MIKDKQTYITIQQFLSGLKMDRNEWYEGTNLSYRAQLLYCGDDTEWTSELQWYINQSLNDVMFHRDTVRVSFSSTIINSLTAELAHFVSTQIRSCADRAYSEAGVCEIYDREFPPVFFEKFIIKIWVFVNTDGGDDDAGIKVYIRPV